MAITGKPHALSWTALVETGLKEPTDFDEDLSIDKRIENHNQRIKANKEGFDNIGKRIDSADDSLDSFEREAGESIIGVRNTVSDTFKDIKGKDKPDDYDDIREKLSALKEDIESAAAAVGQYRSFGFNAAEWRKRRTQLLDLEAEVSSAPTRYNSVAYTNIGLLTEDTVDENFRSRIIGGTFAAIKGNLRCKTGDNPFTGWWFCYMDSGCGMICNLYTLDVLSVSKKNHDSGIKFRVIFRNGTAALSDQELFPDEKILIDVLMAEGLTADLWHKMVSDISRLYRCLTAVELLQAAGLNSTSWSAVVSDLEQSKSATDVCFETLSVKNWRRVLKALLGQEEEMSKKESVILKALMESGINKQAWYDLLVAIENLRSVIYRTNRLKGAGFGITGWEELLAVTEQAKRMAAFVRQVKDAGFEESSWSFVQKALVDKKDY